MLQLGREILSFTLHFLLQKECQALTTVYTLYSHSHYTLTLRQILVVKGNGKGKETLLIFRPVARNSHQSNKECAHLTPPPYPPLSTNTPFYGYLKLLKAIQKGKKVKEGFEVTAGNQTRDLLHKRLRTHTNQLC